MHPFEKCGHYHTKVVVRVAVQFLRLYSVLYPLSQLGNLKQWKKEPLKAFVNLIKRIACSTICQVFMFIFFFFGVCHSPRIVPFNATQTVFPTAYIGALIGGTFESEARLAQLDYFALPGTVSAMYKLL